LSPHHPRAPLRVTQRNALGDLYEAKLLAHRRSGPVPMSVEAVRELYPDRATNFSTSLRLVNDTKAGLEAQLLRLDRTLFLRFCLRGWLSMLLVQLKGEA
jgi:hypothetical protein